MNQPDPTKPRISLSYDARDPCTPWSASLGGVVRAMSACSAWAIQKCWEHWQQELRDIDRARRARDASRRW